jgi:hypothetical protein
VCAIGLKRGAMFVLVLLPMAEMASGEGARLALPIACEVGRTCVIQNYVDHGPPPQARDYRCGTLTHAGHSGTDFRLLSTAAQRSGVDVLIAADGEVLRTRDEMPDVLFAAATAQPVEGRECGNGVVIKHADGWQTQYCHLALGSVRVKPGTRVVSGQPIGRVGLSGKTEFPHLHFTVRHANRVIDPFAFGAADGECGTGGSLWSSEAEAFLAYRERSVLNAGFAPNPVTMDMVESGNAAQDPLRDDAPTLVAFVRAIGLKAGDVQRLSFRGPDRGVMADHSAPPLQGNKAQTLLFVGARRPPAGWTRGSYVAEYTVGQANGPSLAWSFQAQVSSPDR